MIALYADFRPRYCPNCGAECRWSDRPGEGGGHPQDYAAHCTYDCPKNCGLMYQLADRARVIEAAEASGGDLARHA